MPSKWQTIWGGDWERVKPFYERFREPTPVQENAIPLIQQGQDAVVIAPTASGKTEAILPPLLVRHRQSLVPESGPLIVYVAPTRALVADVVKRIRNPLRRMGGVVGQRTSDRRTWDEGQPCTVLVTTPESLDSISMRTPQSLSNLVGFVADEIHLLEGGPRGLQLRLVLERIEETIGHSLQHVLASATIPPIKELSNRWCNDAEIIEIPGTHELDATILRRDQVGDWTSELATEIKKRGRTKVLAFANSRKFVERFATSVGDKLGSEGWLVRTHHSSLSRDERVRTEQEFHENDHVMVAATSTLEVGIDIGDVDLVVLDGPPFTMNSFLQRIGRGCRRTERREVIGIADSGLDARVFQALVQAGREGRSDGRLSPPLIAVAVQQIASALQQKSTESKPGQQSFLKREVLEDLLRPAVSRVRNPSQFIEACIDAAISVGYIQAEEAWDGSDTFETITRGPDLGNAINAPTFHVCFTPSGGDIDVVLEGDGRTIGDIQRGDYQVGSVIHLSGRPWRVKRVKKDKLFVRALPESMGQIPSFTPQPSGNISQELAREVSQLVWPEWDDGTVAYYPDEQGYTYAHFIGFEAAAILGRYLQNRGYEVSDINPYTFHCDTLWHQNDLLPTAKELKELLHRQPTLIEYLEDLGRLYRYLRDEYGAIQARHIYDWSELEARYRNLEFIEVEDDAITWNLEKPTPIFEV